MDDTSIDEHKRKHSYEHLWSFRVLFHWNVAEIFPISRWCTVVNLSCEVNTHKITTHALDLRIIRVGRTVMTPGGGGGRHSRIMAV